MINNANFFTPHIADLHTMGHVPAWMDQVLFIIQLICSVISVSAAIPQVIKVIKEKRVGNVSYASFWVWHYGSFCWVAFEAFAPGIFQFPNGSYFSSYLISFVADMTSLVINGILLIMLYYYNPNLIKKKSIRAYCLIALNWTLMIVFICVHFTTFQTEHFMNGIYYPEAHRVIRFSQTAATVFSLLCPALTVTWLIPQLIKSYKLAKWDGVSVWTFIFLFVINCLWLFWYSVSISQQVILLGNKGQYGEMAGGLVWQLIYFATVIAQIVGYALNKRKLKQQAAVRTWLFATIRARNAKHIGS